MGTSSIELCLLMPREITRPLRSFIVNKLVNNVMIVAPVLPFVKSDFGARVGIERLSTKRKRRSSENTGRDVVTIYRAVEKHLLRHGTFRVTP